MNGFRKKSWEGNVYLIDSNALIQPYKEYYGMDIVPGFWVFLEQEIHKGTVVIIQQVKKEVLSFHEQDELKRFIGSLPASLIMKPEVKTQTAYSDIARYTSEEFPENQSSQFLRGADGWLIAEANVRNGIIVTLESERKKGKITIFQAGALLPDTKIVRPWDMLRDLSASFTLDSI